MADAFLDRAPLVALTGQSGLERMHKESHQYIDVMRLMSPITKWNARVSGPGIIPEAVRKAFKVAESEKPGATHLELPEDVMAAPVSASPLPRTAVVHPRPADGDLDRAAKLLESADHPVVLAGNGVVRGMAWDSAARVLGPHRRAGRRDVHGQGPVGRKGPARPRRSRAPGGRLRDGRVR